MLSFIIALLLAGSSAVPARHSHEAKTLAHSTKIHNFAIDRNQYSAQCLAARDSFDEARCYCKTGCFIDCGNNGTAGEPRRITNPEQCTGTIDDAACAERTCTVLQACDPDNDSANRGDMPGFDYLLTTSGYDCTSSPPRCRRGQLPSSVSISTTNPFGDATTIQTQGYAFGSSSGYCSTSTGGIAPDVGGVLRSGVSGDHCFENLNSGVFGNSNSWITGSTDAYAGIRFPTPMAVQGIALARDQLGDYNDRTGGSITVQLTSVLGQDYAALVDAASADWSSVGAAQTRSGPLSNYIAFSSPVTIASLRIHVAGNQEACFDELQIFAVE
jgi:hypothetical protein